MSPSLSSYSLRLLAQPSACVNRRIYLVSRVPLDADAAARGPAAAGALQIEDKGGERPGGRLPSGNEVRAFH